MTNLIALITAYTLTFHVQVYNPMKGIGMVTCTAVYINEKEALTAAHCVEETTGHMWVKDSNGKSFKASILKQNQKLDLCLLKIECPSHRYVHLGSSFKKGDQIYLISSEEEMEQTYNTGFISNFIKEEDTGTSQIVHSASILPGASGSGLFDKHGDLIGINTQMLHTLSCAVEVTEIKHFLD